MTLAFMVSHNDARRRTERTVLDAIDLLEGQGYGVTIRNKVRELSGTTLSFGQLYTILRRLERRGLAVSRQGEATVARGGRRKLLYTITPKGRKRLPKEVL